MVMQALRTGANGGIGKFILFGLLGMAVAGLALSDFRGTFSGGVGSNDVAKIGDHTIGLQEFHRVVQRNLTQYRQYGITPQQAYKLGVIDKILAGEIRKYFLLNEAENYGIEIGKEQLKNRLSDVIAPQMQEGETPQQTLDNILRLQGFTEATFVAEVKKEMAAEILTGAISNGFAPDTTLMAKNLFLFQNQSRDVDLLIFPNTDIKDTPAPTEEQLQRLYEGVKHVQYKIPETRTVQAALLNPEKIEVNVTLTEQELKDAYESNQDIFTIDEQYVITQVLLNDDAQAQSVYDLTQSGKSLKDAGQEVVGEDAKYIERIPFEAYAMLPVMREALSDKAFGVVKPPVKSPLGVHVMMLDEIIPSSVKPFKTVKAQIEAELKSEKKVDEMFSVVTALEKRLEDGESLESLKDEYQLELFAIENIDRLATNWSVEQIGDNDKQAAIEAIFTIEDGQDFTLLEELPSGMFAAFKMTGKTPESFKPFVQVKAEITAQFIADQQAADNKLRIQKFLAEIETGGSTMQSIATDQGKKIQKIENLTLSGPISAPLSDAMRPTIFQAEVGSHEILPLGDDQFALMQVSGFKLPELSEAEDGQIEAINETLQREAQDEAVLMYIRALGQKYEASINQRLLERAYGGTDEE